MKGSVKKQLAEQGSSQNKEVEDFFGTVREWRAEKEKALSLQEALTVLTYLSGRKLLCAKCGYRWGEWENQYNLHCTQCQHPSQQYNNVTRGSDFERILCKRLGDWVAAFVQGDGQGSGEPTNS